jgi:hypothetical protein
VRRLALLPLLAATVLTLPACKSERAKLEQLVPDGATGMMSVDAKGVVQSALWGKLRSTAEAAGDGKAKAVLDELRDGCKLDFEQVESLVMAFDAFSQSGMGAMRMPNLGTAEALRCADALVVKQGGKSLWTVGEEGGKATVTAEGGEVLGWALDDDTLVVSSKGWASAVQARMKGEGKSAVDGFLAEAMELADRDKHVWIAGEIPAVVTSFLEETPAKGLRRAAATMNFGDQLELAMAAAYTDEAAAKATHDEISGKLDEAKKLAVEQGLPQAAADSLELSLDGSVVRASMKVDLAPLFESSTQAFTGYMNRSKTSEAKIHLSRMFDATSAYLMEERMGPDGMSVLPHVCPNDGRPAGETGITPPLDVACAKGSQGRCTPGGSGDGGYDAKLWAESNIWQQLGFDMQDPHYFHYNFKWRNDATGYGACQFTAQAFGDLDGDGVYSTYERAGAADEYGVNAAAGLYIDQELE